MPSNVGVGTVTVAGALVTPLNTAVIDALPVATAFARPPDDAIVATLGAAETHATVEVISPVVLSE